MNPPRTMKGAGVDILALCALCELWLQLFCKPVGVLCSRYDWQRDYFDNGDNASAGDSEVVSECQGSLHLTPLYELDVAPRRRTSDHSFSGLLADHAMLWEVYLDDGPLRVAGVQVQTLKA